MDANYQFNFLQERIEEIGSAIFHNLSDAVLKLPTSIVSTSKVDEYGFVWFYVQKPIQQLTEFEQEFPVKLDYYKKGKGSIQVTGKGFVVKDPEEINSFATQFNEHSTPLQKTHILLKVKIQKAEYCETRTAQNISWWQQAWNMFTVWFRHNSYRTGNVYFPAMVNE